MTLPPHPLLTGSTITPTHVSFVLHHLASNCTILRIKVSPQHSPETPAPPASRRKEDSPLSPLLIKNPMSTFLTPNSITPTQAHFTRAFSADILNLCSRAAGQVGGHTETGGGAAAIGGLRGGCRGEGVCFALGRRHRCGDRRVM